MQGRDPGSVTYHCLFKRTKHAFMLVLDPVEDFMNFLYHVELGEILLLLLGLEPMQLSSEVRTFFSTQNEISFPSHWVGDVYLENCTWLSSSVQRSEWLQAM
ncbi:F-box only protein 24 [Platysternon megacephalum]|uniref:F-box only protein 24 n=1 Tax=Platysternon megacephalum TaxID=55544 RepID=A0A4D9DSS0_9SAUR|nr:F-box only protein 24 [Platysternon megacephalum]